MPDVRLLGPAELRAIAAEEDIRPTKRLGQNFVHDANTVRRIVRLAGVEPYETVLEVGPGLGSLTLGLLEAGAVVTAVEIDARLAARLPVTVAAAGGRDAADRLTVVVDDALRVGRVPGDPVRLVANLPYNVSVPVLLHLMATQPSLASGVVMVQAEVGERLAAPPGDRTYGVPSVKAAWYGAWRVAGRVPRSVFWPEPNVDSVLVAFERGAEPGAEALRRRVFRVVDAAFAQRRKTVRQALSALAGGTAASRSVLERAGVAADARGESLDLAAFVRVAEALQVSRGAPDGPPPGASEAVH